MDGSQETVGLGNSTQKLIYPEEPGEPGHTHPEPDEPSYADEPTPDIATLEDKPGHTDKGDSIPDHYDPSLPEITLNPHKPVSNLSTTGGIWKSILISQYRPSTTKNATTTSTKRTPDVDISKISTGPYYTRSGTPNLRSTSNSAMITGSPDLEDVGTCYITPFGGLLFCVAIGIAFVLA